MSGRTKTNEFADDLKKAVEVLKREELYCTQ